MEISGGDTLLGFGPWLCFFPSKWWTVQFEPDPQEIVHLDLHPYVECLNLVPEWLSLVYLNSSVHSLNSSTSYPQYNNKIHVVSDNYEFGQVLSLLLHPSFHIVTTEYNICVYIYFIDKKPVLPPIYKEPI